MKITQCIIWIIMLLEIELFDRTQQIEVTNSDKSGIPEGFIKGLSQKQASHLACKCPTGFYGRETLVIVAHTDICKGENGGGFLDENKGTMLKSIFRPNDKPNIRKRSAEDKDKVNDGGKNENPEGVFFVNMQMCHSCAVGCAKCRGPKETDCSQCLSGYYMNYHKHDQQFERDHLARRFKRSKTTAHPPRTNPDTAADDQRGSGWPKLYEDDELLLLDVPSRTNETKIAKNSTNSDNSTNDSVYKLANLTEVDDYTKPEEEYESSGEIDINGKEEGSLKDISLEENTTWPSLAITEPKPDDSFDAENYYYNEDVEEDDANVNPEDAELQYGYGSPVRNHGGIHHASTSNGLNADQHIHQILSKTETQTSKNMSNTRKVEETTTALDIPELANGMKNYTGIQGPNQTEQTSNEPQSNNSSSAPQETGKWSPSSTATTQEPRSASTVPPTVGVSFSCVSKCPTGFFPDGDGICLQCHRECVGCSGIGPDKCIECLHFKQGLRCVASCNSSEDNLDCTFVFEEDDLSEASEKSVPAGYYAIPPVTVLLVSGIIFTCYYRKRRKLQNSFSWKADKRYTKGSNRHNGEHGDHKKCYYKSGSKTPPHVYALTEFRTSPDPIKRPGNPYVYAERPLLPKYAHQGTALSPAWSAGRNTSEEEVFDPLYETPDNTMDMEALRRYHQRRRSSPIHHHHLASSLKFKEVSQSVEDNQETSDQSLNSMVKDDPGKSNSERAQENFEEENPHKENRTTDLEAPYFQAPPLPVRNSPRPQSALIEDHIYANIDEKT